MWDEAHDEVLEDRDAGNFATTAKGARCERLGSQRSLSWRCCYPQRSGRREIMSGLNFNCFRDGGAHPDRAARLVQRDALPQSRRHAPPLGRGHPRRHPAPDGSRKSCIRPGFHRSADRGHSAERDRRRALLIANKGGAYLIFCGVPGHWGVRHVDSSRRFGIGADADSSGHARREVILCGG